MTNEEKAIEIAKQNAREYLPQNPGFSMDECEKSALEMAEWKDQNPSEELIKKICELCDKFDRYAFWQSVGWLEHADKDDWENEKQHRINLIKSNLSKK